MSCTCNQNMKPKQPSNLYFYTISGNPVAVYATVNIKQDCSIPYWCNNLSAYNNSTPTGTISAGSLTGKILPINAKYSLNLLINDIQNNQLKSLDYYGTIFNLNGKIVRYDPCVMNANVSVVSKDFFVNTIKPIPNILTNDNNTSNKSAAPPPNYSAGDVIQELNKPVTVSVGLLLVLFGIGAVIGSK